MDSAKDHSAPPGFCIVCGNGLSGASGVRFCSPECRTDYQQQINARIERSQSDSSPGVRELKEMIFQYIDYANSITDERRLEFYENVVEKTALLLKYVNDSGSSADIDLREQLRQSQESNRLLKQKLERLLQKAGDLKRENKKLREAFHQPTTEVHELARIMLGVKEDADISEIKRAYRIKAKLTHPDSSQGDADLFKGITEAMIILLANKDN